MAVVVVRESVSVADGSGGVVHLHRGDAWDSSHPLVKLHPAMFSADVPAERRGREVEQATAAPGEKRRA